MLKKHLWKLTMHDTNHANKSKTVHDSYFIDATLQTCWLTQSTTHLYHMQSTGHWSHASFNMRGYALDQATMLTNKTYLSKTCKGVFSSVRRFWRKHYLEWKFHVPESYINKKHMKGECLPYHAASPLVAPIWGNKSILMLACNWKRLSDDHKLSSINSL